MHHLNLTDENVDDLLAAIDAYIYWELAPDHAKWSGMVRDELVAGPRRRDIHRLRQLEGTLAALPRGAGGQS